MKELPSEEEEIPFRIKTYKKKELACMYNPNITPPVAPYAYSPNGLK